MSSFLYAALNLLAKLSVSAHALVNLVNVSIKAASLFSRVALSVFGSWVSFCAHMAFKRRKISNLNASSSSSF